MIEVVNLHKSFGDLKVLKGVNTKIEKQEVLLEPAVQAKAPFYAVLTLEEPDDGEI